MKCFGMTNEQVIFLDSQYLISHQELLKIIKAAKEGNIQIKEVSNPSGYVKDLEVKSDIINKTFSFGGFVPEIISVTN